jgi:acetolactate synthase-1/2/3 large subunit
VEHANAAAALRAFAELWRIPVATTLRAKGVFPEDHDLSLGVFGYAGTHHARSAMMDPAFDLLIVLGSGLNERDTMHWALDIKPDAMICVNVSSTAIGVNTQSGGVVGDCGAYLRFLLSRSDALEPLRKSAPARDAWLKEIRSGPRLQDVENCVSDATPVHPARIGLSPGTIGNHMSRALIFPPPISGRWAGRSAPLSAFNARAWRGSGSRRVDAASRP